MKENLNGDNGDIKHQESCPFYELGTADFHAYRIEMVTELRRLNNVMSTHCELLAETLQSAYLRSTGVPLKTHIYTIAAVIIGVLGVDALQALMK